MAPKKHLGLTLALAGLCVLVSPAAFGDLYGIEYDTGYLYSISPADASMTYIGSTGLVSGLGSLEYYVNDSGQLYGFTCGDAAAARLYSINPSTAEAMEIGPLGLNFVYEGGLAFSPAGIAYGVNANNVATPQLFTIDLDTGAGTVVATLSGGQRDVGGLAWRSDGMLVGLERVSNALVEIDPATGATSVIATLNPDYVGAVGGMAAMGDTGYFACGNTYSSIPGSNALYSFDLYTGDYQFIGGFAPTVTGIGISGLAIPEPGCLGLVALGVTALLRRR
jgi:hypothetical protein